MSHFFINSRDRILVLLLIYLATAGINNINGQTSFGLQFYSHEKVPEKRTSLNLSGERPFCFTNRLDLSFDLSFASGYNTYFGYIFRLINDKGQNIDLLFDQRKQSFRLVAGENFTDIYFQVEDSVLKRSWLPLHFSFIADGNLSLVAPGRTWRTRVASFSSTCVKIIFGTSGEQNFITTDLPPMKIRNIDLLIDNKNHHFWSLNESGGNEAVDSIHRFAAKVVNPGWINPRHTNWSELASLNVRGRPSVAFDKNKELLFVVCVDSLYAISISNGAIEGTAFSVPHANLLAGNQSIVNPFDGNLYNFYPDENVICVYDPGARRWTQNFKTGNSTERWHLNKFFTDRNELYILGGYGQLKYKNIIQRHDLSSPNWDTLKPAGDFFSPRYLAALGTTGSGDTAYILGGFGSKEGDQLLNPRFFYDLLLYDVHGNRIKKVYDLPTPEEQFVFANSLVIDSLTKSYYALIFPNNRFNSQLQLIRGSLIQPQYTRLGTPFPFLFSDVWSFADLYYSPKSNKLIAVTIYSDKSGLSRVKVFSIDFPVNELAAASVPMKPAKGRSVLPVLYLCLAVAFCGFILFWYYRKRKTSPRREKEEEAGADVVSVQPPPTVHPHPSPVQKVSRISLFGNFEVVTSEGANITRYFTPLLKEMFLLILIYSLRFRKGVTSEKMNDILWNDKDIKDAQNNRSVNLVKLKNILEKLGGCSISRKTAAWMFEFDPMLLQIDFFEYLDLSNKANDEDPAVRANRLLAIVKNGSFLQQTDYEWLNDIKAEISNFVIEALVKYTGTFTLPADAEKSITIANEIFQFDELNEHALIIKCKSLASLGRHALAKSTFDRFITKYKHIYGADFEMSYSKIING